MRHAVQIKIADQRQTKTRIEPRRRQKLLPERLTAQLGERFIALKSFNVKDDLAHEGKPVGMEPRGRQPQKHVVRAHPIAGNDPRPLHDADGKARDVILSGRIKAAHLRRFAADQGAARLFTRPRHAFNDRSHLLRQELSHRQIIEKKERFRSRRENIVHAHRHRVLPDGVVPIQKKRQPQLRPHAVGARYQHRLFIFPKGKGKHAAKAAEIAEHLRAVRRTHAVFNELNGIIARVNIDPGVAVSEFFFHYALLEHEKAQSLAPAPRRLQPRRAPMNCAFL